MRKFISLHVKLKKPGSFSSDRFGLVFDSFAQVCLEYIEVFLERVSIECRKTKIKEITLANQKDEDNPVNQSKLEVITRSRHKARENVYAQATIGFGFTSDWLKKWHENFETITE